MDLVANLQPAKEIVPAVGSFYDPATGFESRVVLAFLFFLSARLDMRCVPATRCRATQLRIVIAFVTAQMLARLLFGRRSLNNDRIQRHPESLHVVPVGAREGDRQRDAVGIGKIVPLGAQFAPVGRVFSGLVPPLTGADTVAESSDWNRQSIPLRSS